MKKIHSQNYSLSNESFDASGKEVPLSTSQFAVTRRSEMTQNKKGGPYLSEQELEQLRLGYFL